MRHHLLLAGVLLATTGFTGCGRQNSSDTAEVVYNCPANAADIDALKNEIPAFTAESRITIKLNPFTGQDKLYAMMAAGQAPDIFYTNTTMRDRLAAEGRLLDLRTVSSGDPFVHRLWPAVIANGTSPDSGWYSLGNWSFTLGVYYNRDLFDAARLPYPDTAWTWETMRMLARRLTVDANGDGVPERFGVFIGSHFVEAIEQMNGADIRPNTLLASLPEASAEAFTKYLALMEEQLMPDIRRVQAMGMQPVQLLQSGKVAMLVEAVPHQMLIETLAIRWGVAPLPRFAGKPPRYFRTSSGGLSISSGTRFPEAAWQGVKWIVGKASIYQPNPVLRDLDFVGGWERRYPRLAGSGFRDVWNLSLEHDGGDPRFFVRFSSWTSGSILERLQPYLDRLWAREIGVNDVRSALPEINAHAARDLQDLLQREGIKPAFRRVIERELRNLERGTAQ
jgi:ABC-type glycerol-3-phosphate transport system substrate-binding protein